MTGINLIHIQSPTYGTHPVVHYSPQDRPRHSLKAKHFFLILENDKPTFALEVYVYINVWNDRAERMLYVSKCDTVGMHRSSVRFGEIATSMLEWLVAQDLGQVYCQNITRGKSTSYSSASLSSSSAVNGEKEEVPVNSVHFALVRHLNQLRAPQGAKGKSSYSITVPSNQVTRICLFTRPAEQYLFPGSGGNIHKHTIDGQGLLRWWLKVLDPLVVLKYGCARMTIPSSEDQVISKYLAPLKGDWKPGSLFDKGSGSCIRVIPLLPDDPKGRFLEHLVVEHRYRKVNVPQFWQELGYRQEFRLGVLVGIIGIELTTTPASSSMSNELKITTNKVSRNIYKKLVDVIKSGDFSDAIDVEQLQKRLQQVVELQTQSYVPRIISKAEQIKATPINNLNAMIKRKAVPQVNDLTTLVKRRKNK